MEKEVKIKQRYTVDQLREKGLILLEYVSGSQMYGTNRPDSDIDIKGVFILPDSDFTDINFIPDWEEVESGKFINEKGIECEMKFYELRKFLQMLEKNNPNSLEVFDIPENCIIYKHPLMDAIILNHKKFLTKKSFYSFSGYAIEQTAKAHGKNKKQNWEKERFERKTILDFCYTASYSAKQGSVPIKTFIQELQNLRSFKGKDQTHFGLVKIPHMPFTYGIYAGNKDKVTNEYDFAGCHGMVNESETSTSLKVSEVPKDARPIGTMTFNESAWSIHCDEYRSYLVWQANKNEARWVDVKGHDQKIDGKNMLHMQRLINMATDIALGKGIITRRPEAADLLKIRKGEVSLQALLDSSESKLKELKTLYDANFNLPEIVEPGLCEKLNASIRKTFKPTV